MLVAGGCGDPVDTGGPAPTVEEESAAFDLPFGLLQVDGTEAASAPVVVETTTGTYDGKPVDSTSLNVAYWVTGDPEQVLREWADQLAELDLGEVSWTTPDMHESDAPLPWVALAAYSYHPDGPGPGSASVELWNTEDEPLLLVGVGVNSDVEPTEPVPTTGPNAPERIPTAPAPITATPAAAGGVLFSEGADIMVPEGATAVTPTVPTQGGTGGNTVVVEAADIEAVARWIVEEGNRINESAEQHEPGQIIGPAVGNTNGAETVTASFNSGSGGWTVNIVGSKAAGAEVGTLWIETSAD